MTLFVLIITLLTYAQSVQSSTQSETVKSLTFGNYSQRLYQVALMANDYIYVGGTNSILQLNHSDLSVVSTLTVGPQKDHLQCPPYPLQCPLSRKWTDNKVKVLLANDEAVMFCGSTNQGICEIVILVNSEFTNATRMTIGNETNSKNYLSGKRSVIVRASNDVWYSAIAYDGRATSMMPYQISFRKLINEGSQYRWEYVTSSSGIKFKKNYQSKFIINYVQGFTHENFVYFLTTQKTSLNSTTYETRLIQIDKNDMTLSSYVEIPLVCEGSGNFASAAIFGNTNTQILSEFYADKNALYVSFVKLIDVNIVDTAYGSDICVFPISLIGYSFANAVRECFRAEKNLSTIPWIEGSGDYCKPFVAPASTNVDFRGINKYIEGKIAIQGSLLMNIPEHVTMLTVLPQRNRFVGFFGTTKGHLLKVLLTSNPSTSVILKTMTLAEDLPLQYRKMQPAKAFDTNTLEDLYVLTGNKVSKVSISTCSIYTCEECITTGSKDPLGCHWCGTHCASPTECPSFSDTTLQENPCQPMIGKVSPLTGPLEGGTKVTFLGYNLKPTSLTQDAKLNVSIGNENCAVKVWINKKIICQTDFVNNDYNGTINLEIIDSSNVTDVKMISQVFSFVAISLTSFQPKQGWLDGGTNVTIHGRNLAAGSKSRVLIAGIECEIKNIENEKIECTPGPNASLEHGDLPGHVVVQIDNYIQVFEELFIYKSNLIDSDDTASFLLFIPLTVGILFLILMALVSIYCQKRRCQRSRTVSTKPVIKLNITRQNSTPNNYTPPLDRSKRKSLTKSENNKLQKILQELQEKKLLFPVDCLKIGKTIGEGHFGCVCQGRLTLSEGNGDLDVAIKRIKQEYSDEVEVKSFLNEALIMKDFHHDNVLPLTGICVQSDGMPMVITPFMEFGDLLSYLRNAENHPTVRDLLNFGIQIAKGMEYLSTLKFVHRDLAARNCMVDKHLTIKVADFGLSRVMYENTYYRVRNNKTKLPVKWMAIESLEKGHFSIKSDVWSFGVVLWELITRGVCPYPDVDNWEIVCYLKSGRRLPRSSYCPDLLYELMLMCWLEDVHARPTFKGLIERIKSIIWTMEKNDRLKEVDLNVIYVNHPTN